METAKPAGKMRAAGLRAVRPRGTGAGIWAFAAASIGGLDGDLNEEAKAARIDMREQAKKRR